MPVIKMTLIEGYDEITRHKLMQRVTDAVRATIAAPLEAITIAIDEVSPGSYMRGRSARRPGAPQPAAAELVNDYLMAMQQRDLPRAGECLHKDFCMVFPGGQTMHQLDELIDWSRSRYQSISKQIDAVEECFGSDGMTVYCHGTLSGSWPDGEPFSDIRFIDRFVLADGKIKTQWVWNDLAEALRAAS